MHPEAYTYVRNQLHGKPLTGATVLEIGSYNVNGSVRPLCAGAASYQGIDVRAGRGVDEVADAADFDGHGEYDLVISTETMEHMEHPEALIACALRALKPGGLLLITAAAPERAPHGVDGGAPSKGEAYTAISPDALSEWLSGWEGVQVWHYPERGDVYARARAPKPPVVEEPKKSTKKAAATSAPAEVTA